MRHGARPAFHDSFHATLVIRLETATLGGTGIRFCIMFAIANAVLLPASIVALVAVVLTLRQYFNADARETRRRSRSHGPVISRKRGPSVRLAVEVDKPKRRRKH